MMFFSMASWNRVGRGRSMERKRNGEIVDFISRSMSKRGFASPPPETMTCCVLTRS